MSKTTEVKLNRKEARQIIRTYDKLVRWVRNHEELCEERMELYALQRSVRSAGVIYDRIEGELK